MCGFPLWRNGLHRLSNITCSRPYHMCWDHSVYMGAYGHIRRLYRCLMAISIYMYHKLFGSMALSSANTSTNNLSTDTDVPHVRISLQLEMFFSMPHYRTVLHEGGGGAHAFVAAPEMAHEICSLKFLSLLRVFARCHIISPVETIRCLCLVFLLRQGLLCLNQNELKLPLRRLILTGNTVFVNTRV